MFMHITFYLGQRVEIKDTCVFSLKTNVYFDSVIGALTNSCLEGLTK